MSEVNVLQIFEASADELEECLLRLAPGTPLALYALILKHYLRGQSSDLRSVWESLSRQKKDEATWTWIEELAGVRVCIRENIKYTAGTLRAREDIESLQIPLPWQAEMATVWAMYWEVQKNEPRAKDLYLLAQRLFLDAGFKKKAAKAYQNSVAAESRINPQRRLIPEYHHAAQMAKEAQDWNCAGTALSNLSREFQLMKAPHVALKIVNEALEYLRMSSYGSYQFYNALCNRCHLNLQLEYFNAALMDYEEASAAPFIEVKGQLATLEEWFKELGMNPMVQSDPSSRPYMRPTWVERVEKKSALEAKGKLSDLEAQLIHTLLEGPCDRHTLIEKLWGSTTDFFSLENRLKQLLHRLRKKEPDLIGFKEGKYFILDSPQYFDQGTL